MKTKKTTRHDLPGWPRSPRAEVATPTRAAASPLLVHRTVPEIGQPAGGDPEGTVNPPGAQVRRHQEAEHSAHQGGSAEDLEGRGGYVAAGGNGAGSGWQPA